MSIREATAALDLPSAEGSNRSCPLPETRRRAKPNRRSLNEREQSRAAAAETRVQELLNDVRRLRAALRKAESKPKPPPGDAGCLQTALKRSQVLTDTVKSLRAEMAGLRTENRRLREDLRVAANRKGTIEYQSRRIELLHELLGTYRNQKDDVRVLSRQVDVLSEDVGFLRPALTRLPQLGGREDANPLIFGDPNIKGRHYRAPNGRGGWRAVRRRAAARAVAAGSSRVGAAEARAPCSAGCGAAGRGAGRRWSADGHPPSGWRRTPR